MWKAINHLGEIRISYVTKQGTVAKIKPTRYGNLRAAKSAAAAENRRAREMRLNPGKYGHCPECAFSAGHGQNCPVAVDEAEQKALKREKEARNELIARVARAIYLADSLNAEEDAREWDANRIDRAQCNAYLSMAKAALDEINREVQVETA